jgi:(2Fe-2S) ferredoxin
MRVAKTQPSVLPRCSLWILQCTSYILLTFHALPLASSWSIRVAISSRSPFHDTYTTVRWNVALHNTPTDATTHVEGHSDAVVVDPHHRATIASQFTILTCASSKCAEQRNQRGLDEYATFSALWERAHTSADSALQQVTVEESPCLGGCAQGPCVAVTHEEYEGTVGLVGMHPAELADRVFYQIVTEEDADRVWNCVTDAIQGMMEQEDNETDEYEYDSDDVYDDVDGEPDDEFKPTGGGVYI